MSLILKSYGSLSHEVFTRFLCGLILGSFIRCYFSDSLGDYRYYKHNTLYKSCCQFCVILLSHFTVCFCPHTCMTTWASVLPDNHGLWQPFSAHPTKRPIQVSVSHYAWWRRKVIAWVTPANDCYWLPPPTVMCFSFTCFITASMSLNPCFPQ